MEKINQYIDLCEEILRDGMAAKDDPDEVLSALFSAPFIGVALLTRGLPHDRRERVFNIVARIAAQTVRANLANLREGAYDA
jgi:hypothetical protein